VVTAIALRPFSVSHIPALVRLSFDAEVVDRYGVVLEERQLLESLQAAPEDFERRCWLAFADWGALVGYLRAERSANSGRQGYWLHGVVHPVWRRQGIGSGLLRKVWPVLAAEADPKYPVQAFSWAFRGDDGRHALFTKYGLTPYHFSWQMARHGLADVPVPTWPDGIQLRPLSEHQLEAIAKLHNLIFNERTGYQMTNAKRLSQGLLSGRFEPELAVIAWRGEQAAGLCLSSLAWTRRARNANEGEIVWLGVAPGERGRGLGQALVHEALLRLKAAGADVVTLGAETTADEIPRLYARCGFIPREVVVDYQGEIEPG
jgi:mycothiol synthase